MYPGMVAQLIASPSQMTHFATRQFSAILNAVAKGKKEQKLRRAPEREPKNRRPATTHEGNGWRMPSV